MTKAADAPATDMGSAFVRRISELARINQLISFNPEATIQRQIIQDGFVPNSGEFESEMPFGQTRYVAQQAEHLRTGEARVYFVKRNQGHRVQWFPVGKASWMDKSGSGQTDMGSAFVRRISELARVNQLICFNPEATIQRQIIQDGFVPNSGEFEFEMPFGQARYVAQQAEHLCIGEVRIYFVKRNQGHRVQWLLPQEG